MGASLALASVSASQAATHAVTFPARHRSHGQLLAESGDGGMLLEAPGAVIHGPGMEEFNVYCH